MTLPDSGKSLPLGFQHHSVQQELYLNMPTSCTNVPLYLLKIQVHVTPRFAKAVRALEHPGLCVCLTKDGISPDIGN